MSCAGLAKEQCNREQQQPKQILSLPPNVNGRRRGTLEIRFPEKSEDGFEGIQWKSTKSYPLVEIQLLWWGQQVSQNSPKAVLRWEQGKTRTVSKLQYEILTSAELFRKYLRTAEPIQARLVSCRTNTLIGTAQIPVPGKLVNFRACGEEFESSSSAAILSGRGFNLGEICVLFCLSFEKIAVKFEDKENKKDIVQSSAMPLPMVRLERETGLTVRGVPAPLHNDITQKQAKTFHSLDNQSRVNVLNYLSGKVLSDCEDEALTDICSISPAQSMIEALNKIETPSKSKKDAYVRAVDSARVIIEGLKFTKAGLKEVFHKAKLGALTEMTFLIKVKTVSQLDTMTRTKFTSNSVSDNGEVTFNAKGIVKLDLPRKYDDFQFEFLLYLILRPTFHQKTPGKGVLIGSSIIKFDELLNNRFGCHKKCPVRLVSDDIMLGMLTVRMELGSRGLHFGPELMDALQGDKENVSISSSSSESEPRHVCWTFKRPSKNSMPPPNCRIHHQCCPTTRSQDERGSGEYQKSNPPTPSQESSSQQRSAAHNPRPQADKTSEDNGPKTMDIQEDYQEPPKNLLHGILHFGQMRDAPSLPAGGYFLVAHSFWSDEDRPVLTTELSQDGKGFNYLITFPVLPNNSFLDRTKNQHMLVELWQKSPGAGEKLVGLTRLPLHQFYIAFRDAQLAEHLARAKLPVISIDDWSGIRSPLVSDPCGQVQAVLAIGTENQIEYFKMSRGLSHTSGDAPMVESSAAVPAVEDVSAPPKSQTSSSTQTNDTPSDILVTPSSAINSRRVYDDYRPINTTNSGKQQSEVANMLSAFIENLAQRLPISSERSTAPCLDQNVAERIISSPHSQANRPQVRKTSELLENLQKALGQLPIATNGSPALLTAPSAQSAPESGSLESTPMGDEFKAPTLSSEEKLFKVSIEIEQAVHLPKLNVSKKYGKRNKNRNAGSSTVPSTGGASNQRFEVEPSAYVTFEGYNLQPGTPNTVKSHEGIVYTTAVVQNCANPSWRKTFEVSLPVDLMTNDEKRFILKIWRKAVNNSDVAKCRMLPAPMEDAVVGFTAVDLSVFLNGMPCILGWYNIMDFSGRCNGQIKVNIKPLENVTIYKGMDESTNFQIPLSIDVECGGTDASNISLSRALKRKFTELEEISQRLKARLFDVTGDENVDPDDEFERDLNTEADEGDDEDWKDPLEDNSSQKRNSQHPNGALTCTTNTSSYTMSAERGRVPERSLTGCSDRSTEQSGIDENEHLILEKLLKQHDLDTLINPAILKNLLNPSILSTAESTPMSNPYANLPESESSGETSQDADMIEDSAEAGGSTSDRVKLISSALQRATISDANETRIGNRNGETDGGMQECIEQQRQREAPEGEPMKVNNK
ncbi:uncharacterized protein LOC129768821 [Toxorhynchites rutilus septentrionalis]|uniref:uncharacterized protein LOC129768821 n=1 Tax=Toxorhynchites rutilus septentrionalis TaxID=329112 RepID=UPI002479B36C|nr:uncharacterized protein LOC129768821 [Toxorhynchites rutilus septentrionalis]